MGDRVVSILCAIVALVGIVSLVIGYKDYSAKQDKTAAVYAELSAKLSDLEAEKREVQGNLVTLEEDIDKIANAKATLNIIFTDMSDVIYTEIFPTMTENGFTGTLAMSAADLPGEAGKLTDDQIAHLMNEGWELIPCWSADDGDTGIAKAEEWIKQYGYDPKGCVMIDSESCTAEVEATLVGAGYNTVITKMTDNSSDVVVNDEIGEVWKPKAVGYLFEERKTVLANAIKTSGHLAFVVGFDENTKNELFGSKVLASMLTYLKSCESGTSLDCMNVSEAKAYRVEADARRREAVADAEARKAEYNAKLEQIEEAIDSIYNEYK